MKQKKKGENLLRNLRSRRKKIMFFIYDVIVKQKKRKRSANHYSCMGVATYATASI
jgi:hypothetical protein